MISNARLAVLTLAMLVTAGCQTASLEDAAPKTAPANSLQVGAAAPAGSEIVVATGAAQSEAPAPDTAPAPTVIRRNPGITSIVPIEKTAPVENKEFVATGANRTGQYPSLGRLPSTANAQLSDAEKTAAEAEMAELLRSRAATPDARAQYESRLRELRALAASHGSDTQQEIEN
ncbi:hypothetical protein IMCC20628_01809 [Hoeflea sp. IMCC20628]|uniref:hypothetical protein n=1 Tax=Hoeflea sp. IMCC20628 TaxID=1620421 RepID=UPI00063A991B|nr:hypothetical protein [Hoeflea sp. IMCC20628]AKI00519.1 hypothetical protein IMCC20628_01809 [Hoeflea sp. IMCC20628]